jgi:trimeric autotransporter adhesin
MNRQACVTAALAAMLALAVSGQYSSTLFAGGGPPNGAPAFAVAVSFVRGIAVDPAGNVYFSSTEQNRVYKVAPDGTISTVAGSGFPGYSGDFGPAASARLFGPRGLAIDSAGALYIADSGNNRIRKVSGGTIITVAGSGAFGFTGDGGLATGAWLQNPQDVAVDSAGNLYIADTGNARVRRVSGGVITTVAGNGTSGPGTGDGGPAVNASVHPAAVAVDSAGRLYIADINNRVRLLQSGIISTIAGNGICGYSGDGGSATAAMICSPQDVGVDSTGSVYIAAGYGVRKVTSGIITAPVTANLYFSDYHKVRKLSAGVLLNVAGNGTYWYSGDGGPAVVSQLHPGPLAADSSGNIYIGDVANYRIRRIAGGVISTVMGMGSNIFSGDGGPATSAQMGDASGIAVSANGDLYLADKVNNRRTQSLERNRHHCSRQRCLGILRRRRTRHQCASDFPQRRSCGQLRSRLHRRLVSQPDPKGIGRNHHCRRGRGSAFRRIRHQRVHYSCPLCRRSRRKRLLRLFRTTPGLQARHDRCPDYNRGHRCARTFG